MGGERTYKWHIRTSGAGCLNSPKMVYYSMLKWSGEQGVVVSEASELLFEGIKKLNAQQRPDVPACFIYTAISYVLMSTKTLYTSFFSVLAKAFLIHAVILHDFCPLSLLLMCVAHAKWTLSCSWILMQKQKVKSLLLLFRVRDLFQVSY